MARDRRAVRVHVLRLGICDTEKEEKDVTEVGSLKLLRHERWKYTVLSRKKK